MYLKKGISAIVATVLIVLITVATVAIIWVAVIPMITKSTTFKDPNLRLDLVASEGYTAYDPDLKLATIQVKRGSDNADLVGFDLIFLIEGNSVKHFISDFPEPNQAKVYYINFTNYSGDPSLVKVAPVFTDGTVGNPISEFKFTVSVVNLEPLIDKDPSNGEENFTKPNRGYLGGGGGGGDNNSGTTTGCTVTNTTYNLTCYNSTLVKYLDNCGGWQADKETCDSGCATGACICVPGCSGRVCGDDGCGGNCGSCGANEYCDNGTCEQDCTKYVSTTGSTSWAACSSESTPCSLTTANQNATAGDVVCLEAGIYTQTLQPANSGTPGNLITFRAYPGDECIGGYEKDSCGVILYGQGQSTVAVRLANRAYVRIEGIEITNWNYDPVISVSYSSSQTADHIEISNNYIHNNSAGRGIFAYRSYNCLFENNEISYNGKTGIVLGNPGENNTIRRNHIHHNGDDGIVAHGNRIIIENNYLHSQYSYIEGIGDDLGYHSDGISGDNLNNSIIRNNLIRDFTQLIYLTVFDSSHNQLFLNNIEIYGNVLNSREYYIDKGGAVAPGIKLEGRGDSGCYIHNISIHSNTLAWTGTSSIIITGNFEGGTHTPITGINIRNNILYNPFDVSIENPSEADSDYNLFYSQTSSECSSKHSICTSAPLFVNYQTPIENPDFNAWDFHLQPTSPAIDAGMDLSLFWITEDIEGNPRPVDGDGLNGAEYDIGAYEYQ